MSVWIFFLIQILMTALDWYFHRKMPLTERQRRYVNHAIYLCREFENKSVELGCSAGGVKMDGAPVYGDNAVDKSLDDNDFGWVPPNRIGDVK